MWTEIMSALEPTLINVVLIVVGLIGTVGVYYLTKASNWFLDKVKAGEAERDAMSALMAGVDHAQEQLVIKLKREAADGKLTIEARKRVRDLAIERAKQLATKEGLNYLKAAGTERLDGAIKQILASWSKKR